MSVQSQQTLPQTQQAPQEDTGPTTSTSGGAGNQARVDALGAAGSGEPRGGTRYTIQRGDTLRHIAETTYGNTRYWSDIMRANPRSVFRGGDLILVGDCLDLPVIRVPVAESTTPAAPTPAPAADQSGGECPAVVPREVCTEYGDFRIFPDDYVGDLPQSTDSSRNVRETEYRELIQTKEAEAEAQTNATVSQVDDLLSYGAFDWAITDSEARSALSKLAALPMRGLQAAVGRINVDRLLSNLPNDCLGTADFCKVAVALGPSRIAPYLSDVLSYGIFDWAVTDSDARAVMAVLGILGAEQRVQVLTQLGREMQIRFMENLPSRGSALAAADKAVLKTIFDNAGSDLTRLELAFSIRFNLDVHGNGGASWDETGLRNAWSVLETLPAAHVEGNPELLQWIRYRNDDGTNKNNHGGWYDDRQQVGGKDNADFRGAGINYNPNNMGGTQDSSFDQDGDGTIAANEKDPLHGVNRFNKVVRHEVGHAVDVQIGAVGRYCLGKPKGGNWADYGSAKATCIDAMVTASAGGVSTASAKTAIVAQLNRDATPANAANALANVQALAEYQAMTQAEKDAVDADPIFTALTQALDDPWYNHLPDGGAPLGGRIFQRSYGSQWTSYAVEARARKVSQYQFRAPGEWFAEAYAAYYEPKADGTCDHSTLNAIDPDTKSWFDANVDGIAGTR